jgi:hypothetical protein
MLLLRLLRLQLQLPQLPSHLLLRLKMPLRQRLLLLMVVLQPS